MCKKDKNQSTEYEKICISQIKKPLKYLKTHWSINNILFTPILFNIVYKFSIFFLFGYKI